MATVTMEWTILERLLLAQAVNKYGDDDWIQVARTLKQHPLLQCSTRLDTFNQKNCSLQYYLMLENMETERRQPKTTNAIISQDMPNVIKLARQLYFQRVEELKESIKKDEDQFMEILSEIDDIKSGAWDVKLQKETNDMLSSPIVTESGAADQDPKETTNQIANASTNNEMESTTDNATLQNQTGVIRHKIKEEDISKLDTTDTIDQSNEPSMSQSQIQQKQHGDRITKYDMESDASDGGSLRMKRQPYDNDYPTKNDGQDYITEPSSKRLRLDTPTTNGKGKDIDYEYNDTETSQQDEPIPVNTRPSYSQTNMSDQLDTQRITSASALTRSSRDTQIPSDTSIDALIDENTGNATVTTESSGNERYSMTESEGDTTTSTKTLEKQH